MPSYKAPIEESLFLLENVFDYEKLCGELDYGESSLDLVAAILNEAGKVSEQVLQPLNLSGDNEGCKRSADGEVTTPKGFKEAYKTFAEGGWMSLGAPEEFGGQNAPHLAGVAVQEYFSSANMAFSMYPGLTMGAVASLLVHSSPELKKTYVPNMIAGPRTGTMNLTEPQCGTDLGLLKTKAVPNKDGSYAITGQKIFISAGDHDLAENIIHLVLARIEGAPAGVKGISLFIAPKFLLTPEGAIGKRNAVTCGALEHKMGIHANATCVMNFDEATGFLVGEAHRGLAAMFVMMNEARLGVAVQGLAMSEVAYQNAAIYANERLQMRSISGVKFPDKPADPIIVHPDIRRNLMDIRSFNEAARGLVMWSALQGDILHRSKDEEARKTADDNLGLMTPVLKSMLSEQGFANAVKAQQIFGGHGYIHEQGMEQFVRDARIAMIYEGANGIQGLDLVGRKLPKDAGRGITNFNKMLYKSMKEFENVPELKACAEAGGKSLADLQSATMWLMKNAMMKPDNAGAASADYLWIFGLVSMGWMWLKIMQAALKKKAQDPSLTAKMDAKLAFGKYFFDHILPETSFRLARLEKGCDTMMSVPADQFIA